MRIAISGPPGSGKTTVCQHVGQKLGYRVVFVGQMFRQMALERKVDLEVFGRLAEEDETIDRDLDERMVAIAVKEENIILEGRLTGILLESKNIPVFSVFIDAPEDVRASRIMEREKKPLDQILREMRKRETSEKKRYLAYYGVDPSDKTRYDLWIDSANMSAEEIARRIVSEARVRHVENARKGKAPI
jgi:predicted cytidylate kinase